MSRQSAQRIALRVHSNPHARRLATELKKKYKFVAESEAANCIDTVVVIGGDGFLLRQLRAALDQPNIPKFFGINTGNSGFLLNHYHGQDLDELLASARQVTLPYLQVTMYDCAGKMHKYNAINEMTLLRSSPQSAHLGISIDGKERMQCLIADGLIVATPAGSTGYNLSLNGPILPLASSLLTLTPISPFKPRHWRGALMEQSAVIAVKVLDANKRPVTLALDNLDAGDCAAVTVKIAENSKVVLLFEPSSNLHDRIIKQQFHSL